MTDREIFRENLNYYLSLQGKKQKDLAEYVGAKTTTVSGWTRGISYPRADAMEKIAMFFGVPTSKLVGKNDHEELDDLIIEEMKVAPKTDEARILANGIDKLTPEERAQALAVVKAMFAQHPELFND